jgi:hypothetical protein
LALATFSLFFSFFEEGEWLGNFGCSKCTRATFDFRDTIGVFTNKFALRFRASGFMAFPVTFRFFTDWFTFWFGCLAMSNAMGLFADCNTFWAVEHFTSLIRAFNFTFGFFAFDVANGVFGFGTGSVALGGFANWVANGGAMWVVTFP